MGDVLLVGQAMNTDNHPQRLEALLYLILSTVITNYLIPGVIIIIFLYKCKTPRGQFTILMKKMDHRMINLFT